MECSWAWYIIIAYPCVVTAPSATIIGHETGRKLGSEGTSCSFSLLPPHQITTRMSGLLDLLWPPEHAFSCTTFSATFKTGTELNLPGGSEGSRKPSFSTGFQGPECLCAPQESKQRKTSSWHLDIWGPQGRPWPPNMAMLELSGFRTCPLNTKSGWYAGRVNAHYAYRSDSTAYLIQWCFMVLH